MPLPSVVHHHAVQCHATSKRSGRRCRNPAAYGMRVCRFHGARKPDTVLRGEDHPAYRHGEATQEAKAAHSAELAEIRQLEQQLREMQLIRGPRTRGRKPKG